MCGIIGTVGTANAADAVIEGLKRLEYRGYDSAGVATLKDGKIQRVRAAGKIANLEEKIATTPALGSTGIGHTRWATHGIPNEPNAHPHMSSNVAVVHNGIIENHKELREFLQKRGVEFTSQTDTEIIPHLVTHFLNKGYTPEEAVGFTIDRLEGAYALGIIFADHPDMIIATRSGSPLALGYADNDIAFIGSDAYALSPFCHSISYLEEGDMAVIHSDRVHIFNHKKQAVERVKRPLIKDNDPNDKGDFDHYMLKEIYEQTSTIAATVSALTQQDEDDIAITFSEAPFSLKDIPHITIVACGTSYYAGMAARTWFEQVARIPASVDVASEFRYRKPIMTEGGVALFISQSGETADTLAAMRYCQSVGQHTLALVNVEESSMAIEADGYMLTRAGTEIGVASTKAFTAQLVALASLSITFARESGIMDDETHRELVHALGTASTITEEALALDVRTKEIAKDIHTAADMLFIGRGTSYAIACEGALKMKEISYIHAEAYAAGELKHGPLALIDEHVPVIAVAPHDELFEKTASNIQEVAARGGRIIVLSNKEGCAALRDISESCITVPDCHPLIAPIIYTIPLQLLSYHTAVLKETDVDQPRNLAKSVTVE